jgi:hypothetical protein
VVGRKKSKQAVSVCRELERLVGKLLRWHEAETILSPCPLGSSA